METIKSKNDIKFGDVFTFYNIYGDEKTAIFINFLNKNDDEDTSFLCIKSTEPYKDNLFYYKYDDKNYRIENNISKMDLKKVSPRIKYSLPYEEKIKLNNKIKAIYDMRTDTKEHNDQIKRYVSIGQILRFKDEKLVVIIARNNRLFFAFEVTHEGKLDFEKINFFYENEKVYVSGYLNKKYLELFTNDYQEYFSKEDNKIYARLKK